MRNITACKRCVEWKGLSFEAFRVSYYSYQTIVNSEYTYIRYGASRDCKKKEHKSAKCINIDENNNKRQRINRSNICEYRL